MIYSLLRQVQKRALMSNSYLKIWPPIYREFKVPGVKILAMPAARVTLVWEKVVRKWERIPIDLSCQQMEGQSNAHQI